MSEYINKTFMENHYASMLLNPSPDVTAEDKKKARIILDALKMEKPADVVECKRDAEDALWIKVDDLKGICQIIAEQGRWCRRFELEDTSWEEVRWSMFEETETNEPTTEDCSMVTDCSWK